MLNVRVDSSRNAQLPECSLDDIRQEARARATRAEAEVRLVREVEAFLQQVEKLGFMAFPLHVNGATIDLRVILIHGPASGPAVVLPDEAVAVGREFSDLAGLVPDVAPAAGLADASAPDDVLARPAPVVEPVAPEPAPESARAALAAEWTAAEDDLLVREVSARMARGLARSAAAAEAAALLPGRRVAAVKYRCATKLRDRLRGAATADVKPPEEAKALPVAREPAPDPEPDDFEAALAETAPPAAVLSGGGAAAMPRWQRELSERLDRLAQRNQTWAAADDLAIIEGKAKGMATTALADALGVSVRAVIERHHLLLPVKTVVETERLLIELRRRVALSEQVAA